MAKFRRTRRFKKGKKLSPDTTRAVKRIVQKAISKNSEMKQAQSSVAPVAVYGQLAGVYQTLLTDMKQGLTDSDRIGDEINLKGISITCLLRNNSSNEYNDIRIIVAQYKSTDFSPSVTEMLITNQAVLVGVQEFNAYSQYNIDYKGSYVVLYDKTIHLEQGLVNALNYGETGTTWKSHKFHVPLKYANKTIQYSAATQDALNGIWIFVIGSSASVANNPRFSMTYSVRFTDS